LGIRNIIKNIRRSILTISTIIIGMVFLILANGFINYTLWGFREGIIRGGIGHFQIYKKGFLAQGDEKPFEYLITDYNKIIKEINKIPGIKAVTPRLGFRGLLANSDNSAIILGNAGDPVGEESMFGAFSSVVDGQNITEEDTNGLLIGKSVAKKLKLKAGDPCTVIVSMNDGSINALDFNISGVKRLVIQELDKVYALANIKTVQELLNVSNSSDSLVLLLTRTEDVERTENKVSQICDKFGLEYRRWDQIFPMYYDAKKFYSSALDFAMFIIFSITIFAIANTMMMVLFERIREIGTIRSLGTTRIKVLKIIMSESLILGFIGSAIGIISGFTLSYLVNSLGGIHVSIPGQPSGYQAHIRPDITVVSIYFLLFIIISAIAVIYPLIKAARMSIADALRWI
jgi:putative ABC transport system permease protein